VAQFLLGRLALVALVLQLLAGLTRQVDEGELLQELLDGLGAHVGLEGVAVLLAGLAVVLLGEQLALLQLGVAGVADAVLLEVDDHLRPRGHRRGDRRPPQG
jgi:hypothetical protein